MLSFEYSNNQDFLWYDGSIRNDTISLIIVTLDGQSYSLHTHTLTMEETLKLSKEDRI